MAIVEFTISIEIPESDNFSREEWEVVELSFDKMLSNMEEIVGKSEYYLDYSRWDYV